MEDWRGCAADGRTDSSRSSLLDGQASDVVSYTQRINVADSLYFSQQQQQQQQQQHYAPQQYTQQQFMQQATYTVQQHHGYPSQEGELFRAAPAQHDHPASLSCRW